MSTIFNWNDTWPYSVAVVKAERCYSQWSHIPVVINTMRVDRHHSMFLGTSKSLFHLFFFLKTKHTRAHQASPTSAALAASPQTSGFQDIHPCLSFVGWHRSCVPSWRMYAGYRCWLPSSAVCWQLNVLGQEITQPVWWPLFRHRRANAVEQSAWTVSATGHHLRTIQMIVENVYVWLVGPRRSVSER